jgi:hypothetical protein
LYGLLFNLAERLQEKSIPRFDEREPRRFRQFYSAYPQIRDAASPESALSASLLINRLSFTLFRLLLEIEDSLKRVFYEIECNNENWTVRKLKRKIGSLYFERSASANCHNMKFLV